MSIYTHSNYSCITSSNSPTCLSQQSVNHHMNTHFPWNHTASSPQHFITLHRIRTLTLLVKLPIGHPHITTTHLLCKRRVIFCGERPIRSLILSFKFDTLAFGETERVNEGPIVGCILTDILFVLSLLKVGVAILSHT